MEIMEIRAFSKRWCEKTRACLYFIFSQFQCIFYLDQFTSFLFLPPDQRKQCNVSCFADTNFFAIFRILKKVITSRVYKFILISGCERNLLKEPFFLFEILKNSQLINSISSVCLSLLFFSFSGDVK